MGSDNRSTYLFRFPYGGEGLGFEPKYGRNAGTRDALEIACHLG